MITSILRGTRSDSLAFVTRGEEKENKSLGIEDKGISKVAKLEIKEEVKWNKWIKVTNAIEGTRGQGKL
jgi:hypothetical protein